MNVLNELRGARSLDFGVSDEECLSCEIESSILSAESLDSPRVQDPAEDLCSDSYSGPSRVHARKHASSNSK